VEDSGARRWRLVRGGGRVRPCPTPPFAGPSYPDVRCRFKWPGELPIDSVSCSDPSTRPAEADQAVRGPHNGLGNRPDPSRRCAASVQAAQGAPNGLEDRYDPCPRRAEPVQAVGEHPMHLVCPSTAKITRGTPPAQIPTILHDSPSSFCIQKCSCRYRLSRGI
jgi:hypothetical protein